MSYLKLLLNYNNVNVIIKPILKQALRPVGFHEAIFFATANLIPEHNIKEFRITLAVRES